MTEDTLLRLNRALAQAGVCSRRKADELIQAGRVRVNGALVESPGLRIDPARDTVAVDGRTIALGRDEELYLLLHKPPHVMTTLSDPEGRGTVLDLLPPDLAAQRPVPVGRLDYMSEGLLLLTTDGELTLRLTHPRYHLPKVYQVQVRGRVAPEALAVIRKGQRLSDGTKLAPAEVRVLHQDARNTLLELTLIQGVNRQIRRMCQDLGLTILFLRRSAQGPVQLGDLPRGAWRRLRADEVAALRGSVGLDG